MNKPVLETERLRLRLFTEKDIPAIYKIFSNEKVNLFLPWFPIHSIEDAKIFYKKHYENSNDIQFAICLKTDDIPIGYIHVSSQDSYDFGYGLLDSYWRKGIVSEAGRTFINYLKTLGIPYITATHDIKNPHSGYVMQALGMQYQYTYEELCQPKNYLVTFRMYQLNFKSNNYVYTKYWDISNVKFIEKEILAHQHDALDKTKIIK